MVKYKLTDVALKQVAKDVEAGEHLSFLESMKAICKRHDGVGLAAPQIGVSKRVILVCLNSPVKWVWMINPVIVSMGPESIVGVEGCLSCPGIKKYVKRSTHIHVAYLDEKRVPRKRSFQGLEARIIQHEVDHLFGECKVCDTSFMGEAEPVKESSSLWPLFVLLAGT